jgi:plasmid maintenance system antidote protein VapI
MNRTDEYRVWRRGEKRALAELAGISQQHLSNLLHRRTRATPELALRLESSARTIGKQISRTDWIYTKETDHPLFG